MKFRRKPVVIEAEQYRREQERSPVGVCHCDNPNIGRPRVPHVHTPEGPLLVHDGDWIITDARGERRPCRADLFEASHERVDGGSMHLVVIESPFGRNVNGSVASPEIIERNRRYLRACMADCLRRGQAPIASHALYTQPGVLDDSKPEEREKGMLAGWAWHRVAHAVVVYTDLGVTPGMAAGRDHAARMNVTIETRRLGHPWSSEVPDRHGWICSMRCGWADVSSHFERSVGDPCPNCEKPIEDITP